MPTPTPGSDIALAPHPVAPRVELAGITHILQQRNNCGPTTIAMYLGYFGIKRTQAQTAAVLKPNRDDVNVSARELAAYARSQGLGAKVGINGDAGLLRLLLSYGLPVLVESWYEPEPGDGLAHYRLLTGYDDAREQWIVFDPYVMGEIDNPISYRGTYLDYAEFAELWAVLNNTYIVLYTDEAYPAVADILGEDIDEVSMWKRALSQAREKIEEDPRDAFAWFNLGSDLVALGEFEEAAAAYDRAREIGLPWRMLWYQLGPFEAYYEMGRFKEVIGLADTALWDADDNEELHYWKGQALAALGDMTGAKQSWERALQLNPNCAEAAKALAETSNRGARFPLSASENETSEAKLLSRTSGSYSVRQQITISGREQSMTNRAMEKASQRPGPQRPRALSER